MIRIEEKKATKIPGGTSLYITTTTFNQKVIDVLKTCYPYFYDKTMKSWEIPSTRLSKFINQCTKYDDIDITILKDKDKKDKQFLLKSTKTKSFQHQLEAVNYGLNHNNFLLLDSPGLGKTKTIIDLVNELKDRENIEHCLVICGINSLKTNWKKEIEKHSNLSCMIVGERKTKNGNIVFGGIPERVQILSKKINEFFVIINIESLRSKDILKVLKKGPNKFDIVVVDEIHTCKSVTAQQARNLLQLNNAKHKIGLTGTLLLKDPLDLYVPLKWIGKENCTLTNFKAQYVEYGGYFNNEIIGYRNIPALKYQLSECSLRRTKDLLDLPEKNIIDECLDMNDEQATFYKNILDGVLDDIDKVKINTATMLSMITRLRQATTCPSVLTSMQLESVKIKRCAELVEEIVSNDNKVVIWSQFKKSLDEVFPYIKQYNPLICTGDIKEDEISKNVELFQNEDTHKVLLCTAQKMGTGFTLNKASYAIFLDTSYVYGLQEQNEDRIHRIGTKSPVFIYRLWCNNTFDMRIKTLIEQRKALTDFVIDNKIEKDNKELLKSLLTTY